MKILFNRDQTGSALFSLVPLRIGSGVTFTLHATLELESEESALLKRYNLTRAPLVISNPIEDIKNSFRPALLLGIVAFYLLWFIFPFGTAFGLGLLVVLGMTVVYFKTLREQIMVNELLHGGRKFRCDSIVNLIQKEAYLEYICEFLRQLLESAKTWDDREAIPIMPLDRKAAKQAVLEMLARE